MINLKDIHFLENYKEEEHSMYPSFLKYIIVNNPEFTYYHQMFERLFVERSIMTGKHVEIVDIKVQNEEYDLFSFLVGVNKHSDDRIKFLGNILELYDEKKDNIFNSKEYYNSEYYKYCYKLLTNNKKNDFFSKLKVDAKVKSEIQKKVEGIINMYNNMKQHGFTVGDIKNTEPKFSLSYYDLPWAINYFGYIKRRDGAHRRAVAAYLGYETIPTLVFNFEKITQEDLKDSNTFLQNYFMWYKELIKTNISIIKGKRV